MADAANHATTTLLNSTSRRLPRHHDAAETSQHGHTDGEDPHGVCARTGLLAAVLAQLAGVATGYAFAAAATTPTRDASTHRLLLLSGALEYSTVQIGDEASTHRHSGTRAEKETRRMPCLVHFDRVSS